MIKYNVEASFHGNQRYFHRIQGIQRKPSKEPKCKSMTLQNRIVSQCKITVTIQHHSTSLTYSLDYQISTHKDKGTLKNGLAVPLMRAVTDQMAFSYRGTKVWKKFNSNIKETPSVYSLKSRFRQLLGYEPAGGTWFANMQVGAAGKSEKLPCPGVRFLKMKPCPGAKGS